METLKTDLTLQEMIYLATQGTSLSSENLRFFSLPGEGGSYFHVYEEEALQVINEHFNPMTLDVTSSDVMIPEYTKKEDQTVNLDGSSLDEAADAKPVIMKNPPTGDGGTPSGTEEAPGETTPENSAEPVVMPEGGSTAGPDGGKDDDASQEGEAGTGIRLEIINSTKDPSVLSFYVDLMTQAGYNVVSAETLSAISYKKTRIINRTEKRLGESLQGIFPSAVMTDDFTDRGVDVTLILGTEIAE
jgi:hypothetical protein